MVGFVLYSFNKLELDEGDKQMEYFISALIPIVAVAIIVIFAKRIALSAYKCKHCSKEFNIKWSKMIVTVHSGSAYLLVCPYCKTKDWCTKQPSK